MLYFCICVVLKMHILGIEVLAFCCHFLGLKVVSSAIKKYNGLKNHLDASKVINRK